MSSVGIQLQKNIDAAEILSGLLITYRSLRRYFNNAIGLVAITFFIAPFLFVILYFVRRHLRKKYLADIVINSDNYVSYRKLYDKLSISLKNIDIPRTYDIPFYLKYIVREFSKTFNIITQSHHQLGKALSDITANSPKSDFFTLRTEAELWESRNKAYDYLI